MLRTALFAHLPAFAAALAIGFALSGAASAAPAPGISWDAEADTGDLDGDGNLEWEDETGVTDADWETGNDVPRGTTSAGSVFTHSYTFDGTTSDATRIENGDSFENLALTPSPEVEDAGFELWFKPSDLSGQEVIWETGGGHGVSFSLNGDQLQFAVGSDDSKAFSTTLPASAPNEFVQVIGSLDLPEPVPGTGSVELFLNGVSQAMDNNFSYSQHGWTGSNGSTLADPGNVGGDKAIDFTNYNVYDGEIALFNFYHDEAINETEAGQLYSQVIPEPGSLALLLPAGLALLRRRR